MNDAGVCNFSELDDYGERSTTLVCGKPGLACGGDGCALVRCDEHAESELHMFDERDGAPEPFAMCSNCCIAQDSAERAREEDAYELWLAQAPQRELEYQELKRYMDCEMKKWLASYKKEWRERHGYDVDCSTADRIASNNNNDQR